MCIELSEHLETANDAVHAIANDGLSALGERIDALHAIAMLAETRAERLSVTMRDCLARRVGTDQINVLYGGDVWRMHEAEAAAMRDQLDVALHVPAPDRPTDPPSRL